MTNVKMINFQKIFKVNNNNIFFALRRCWLSISLCSDTLHILWGHYVTNTSSRTPSLLLKVSDNILAYLQSRNYFLWPVRHRVRRSEYAPHYIYINSGNILSSLPQPTLWLTYFDGGCCLWVLIIKSKYALMKKPTDKANCSSQSNLPWKHLSGSQ